MVRELYSNGNPMNDSEYRIDNKLKIPTPEDYGITNRNIEEAKSNKKLLIFYTIICWLISFIMFLFNPNPLLAFLGIPIPGLIIIYYILKYLLFPTLRKVEKYKEALNEYNIAKYLDKHVIIRNGEEWTVTTYPNLGILVNKARTRYALPIERGYSYTSNAPPIKIREINNDNTLSKRKPYWVSGQGKTWIPGGTAVVRIETNGKIKKHILLDVKRNPNFMIENEMYHYGLNLGSYPRY